MSIKFEHEADEIRFRDRLRCSHDPMLKIESTTSAQCLFRVAVPGPMIVWAAQVVPPSETT